MPLEETGAVTFSGQVLEYWILATELRKQDPRNFIQVVQQRLSGPIGEKLMTMAEQLRHEGKLEGRSEGRLEGKLEGEGGLLIHLLERKFSKISSEYRRDIEKAKSDQLVKWAEKVLESKSLENVFE